MAQYEFIKHLIECKCLLPQYKNTFPPVFHKFLVFSIVDQNGDIIPSYAQCNNCSVVHKIIEVGQSEILKIEESKIVPTIEDIKLSLPEKMIGILQLYDCPLATWQEVKFIIENKMWGRGTVLAKERDGTSVIGKYMVVLGEHLYNIETFQREEGLIDGR